MRFDAARLYLNAVVLAAPAIPAILVDQLSGLSLDQRSGLDIHCGYTAERTTGAHQHAFFVVRTLVVLGHEGVELGLNLLLRTAQAASHEQAQRAAKQHTDEP